MSTWIVRFAEAVPEGALRIAVKDCIDLAGVATSAGCVAVRDSAGPAAADAACLAGIRAAVDTGRATIVGKTTLTELCLSPSGINTAFGTPVNPLDPERIPGGSSSGSAVAVATGEADLALGTDTGGSVRIPAACCGVTGLKTTWGRISTAGVSPLSPSLDTIGPIARDVVGVVTGMGLLDPEWTVAAAPARVLGRLWPDGVDEAMDAALDEALMRSGLTVHNVSIDGWAGSFDAFHTIVQAEFWSAHQSLLGAPGLGSGCARTLELGRAIGAGQLAEAYATQRAWQTELGRAFDRCELLVLPTLVGPPPRLAEARGFPAIALTAPINLAGLPALSMPIPTPGWPGSLQLVGPHGREDLLCATGLFLERVLRQHRESDEGTRG